MKYNDYLFYNEITIHYDDLREIIPNENYSNVTTVGTISIDAQSSANVTITVLEGEYSAVSQVSILDNISIFGQINSDIISNKIGVVSLEVDSDSSNAEIKTVNISTMGTYYNP